MTSRQEGVAPTPLAHRVALDATAAQVAEALVDTWRAIDAALSPIVGSGGVAALYRRSLHLARAAHPWMVAESAEGVDGGMDLAALRSRFAGQGSAEALAAGNALLQTFHGLLASLIGEPLTERLLRPVWHSPSTRTPAQEPPP